MTQEYSKSSHDFNNWTYPFSLFVLNHPFLCRRKFASRLGVPDSFWNFELEGLQLPLHCNRR